MNAPKWVSPPASLIQSVRLGSCMAREGLSSTTNPSGVIIVMLAPLGILG
ncbi:hypothetical protein [Calothrix sp. CCY 0018]